MALIEWKKDETVAILTMNSGENRHNPDFTAAILKALDEIEADPEITSVVIASSDPKSWSQGIDLVWVTGAFNEKRFQDVKSSPPSTATPSATAASWPAAAISAS
jgi:enoyl-CoA hydratase/carnithine racemase